MARLLVIEDDETIGSALESSLSRHGHAVRWMRNGHDALRDTDGHTFDLALVDLGLPDLDGIEVCRRLREVQPGCVQVILTARTEEMDVIVGLEAGADDYLTKPVRLAELHARIRAHLRRESSSGEDQNPIVHGQLHIDPASRRVTVAGRELSLRTKEFDLLLRLAREPGVALRRDTLMADVWDAHWFGSTKTLDVHVAALRRKLANAAPAATLPTISTLRGHGYRLEPPSD
ncbi:response regulator transcription factor [Labedaea rhizosphaerae]|uniref:DNA-binding response OmpR family regulator n=1 Tax=Labedaea rhizosphaerae TaxID=598644 RepID=A0A4R6SG77_LABRH|nr:response regulator transcription factor [Labedaea rhizosphaerae]TDQ00664.1 DNA-binding response OmpR family regulator [Labedaea rhizosphaerae]